MASQRWSSACRRRRSASMLSWSGGEGGDHAADAIFVAQPQSQREERVACGGEGRGWFGVRGRDCGGCLNWSLNERERESGKCEGVNWKMWGMNVEIDTLKKARVQKYENRVLSHNRPIRLSYRTTSMLNTVTTKDMTKAN